MPNSLDAVCPPHHWEVGTANRVETWTCTRCGGIQSESRLVDALYVAVERVWVSRWEYAEFPIYVRGEQLRAKILGGWELVGIHRRKGTGKAAAVMRRPNPRATD